MKKKLKNEFGGDSAESEAYVGWDILSGFLVTRLGLVFWTELTRTFFERVSVFGFPESSMFL